MDPLKLTALALLVLALLGVLAANVEAWRLDQRARRRDPPTEGRDTPGGPPQVG